MRKILFKSFYLLAITFFFSTLAISPKSTYADEETVCPNSDPINRIVFDHAADQTIYFDLSWKVPPENRTGLYVYLEQESDANEPFFKNPPIDGEDNPGSRDNFPVTLETESAPGMKEPDFSKPFKAHLFFRDGNGCSFATATFNISPDAGAPPSNGVDLGGTCKTDGSIKCKEPYQCLGAGATGVGTCGTKSVGADQSCSEAGAVCNDGLVCNETTKKCESVNESNASWECSDNKDCFSGQCDLTNHTCIGGRTALACIEKPPGTGKFVCRTAVGNISTDPNSFGKSILALLMALAGGILLVLIIINGYKMMISQGDPEKIKDAREGIIAAITGILLIIFSLAILRLITADILGIPGFG